jgi:esterase/lipase superfamily enzyme
MADFRSSISELIGQEVVLDTAGPVTFLGTLKGICPEGFWLENADLRDRVEGHATKERYICEARQRGIRANRQRLFVFSHVVVSMSSLKDVVAS